MCGAMPTPPPVKYALRLANGTRSTGLDGVAFLSHVMWAMAFAGYWVSHTAWSPTSARTAPGIHSSDMGAPDVVGDRPRLHQSVELKRESSRLNQSRIRSRSGRRRRGGHRGPDGDGDVALLREQPPDVALVEPRRAVEAPAFAPRVVDTEGFRGGVVGGEHVFVAAGHLARAVDLHEHGLRVGVEHAVQPDGADHDGPGLECGFEGVEAERVTVAGGEPELLQSFGGAEPGGAGVVRRVAAGDVVEPSGELVDADGEVFVDGHD